MHALPFAVALVATVHASPSAATAPRTAVIANDALAAELARSLADDEALRGRPIHIVVASPGAVTLTGEVATLDAKWRAEEIAAHLKGVSSLRDDIVVNAPYHPDASLAAAVDGALKRDPATRSANVTVESNGGVVTVRGAAESAIQRELVADVASRVAGVRGVSLALSVGVPGARRELAIATDAREVLDDDARLDGSLVHLGVHGSDVTLRGIVGSLAQRDAAVEDAWVEGVSNVDADAVLVDWMENERLRPTVARPLPSGPAITHAVTLLLSRDERVGPQAPTVSYDAGKITLTGSVPDERARAAAEADARRARGVSRVDDQLAIVPVSTLPLTAGEVHVYTGGARPAGQGVAVAMGEAPQPVLVTDPLEDVISHRFAHASPSTAPADLGARVEDALTWDPRVGTDHVTVSVGADGNVTLSGRADTWGEARAADEDAARAGAPHVVNLIAVRTPPATPATSRLSHVTFVNRLPVGYELRRVRIFVDGHPVHDAARPGTIAVSPGDHDVHVIADYHMPGNALRFGREVELGSDGTIGGGVAEAGGVGAGARAPAAGAAGQRPALMWRSRVER
jgi:osmotically-inducible protein OsmY